MNYGYNGRGERVHRHLGSDVTYSVYDEAGHWVGDYDASGAPKQQAIWLDDLPVGLLNGAATASNRLHYIEPDHLGSPRAVIEPQRDVAVWTWDIASEAFGNSAPNEDPDGDSTAFVLDMRFPGQRYDVASGLNYNYFRDYEAGVGRYSQPDPIGLAGGIGVYAYVEAAPLRFSDPSGLTRIYEKNGVSFHANPRGSGLNGTPAEHARWGPGGEYHYSLDGPDGPRVNAYTGEPLTPDDAERMSRKQRKVCESLSRNERSYLRRATREVFHHNASALPALRRRLIRLSSPLFFRAEYDSNGGLMGISCDVDPTLDHC